MVSDAVGHTNIQNNVTIIPPALVEISRQGLSCCHGKGEQIRNPLPRASGKNTITRPRLRLRLVLYFACSPWNWVITILYPFDMAAGQTLRYFY